MRLENFSITEVLIVAMLGSVTSFKLQGVHKLDQCDINVQYVVNIYSHVCVPEHVWNRSLTELLVSVGVEYTSGSPAPAHSDVLPLFSSTHV